MPAGVVLVALLLAALDGPGRLVPFLLFDGHGDVEDLAFAQGIMDDMAVRADPVHRHAFSHSVGQGLQRNNAAPDDHVRKGRRRVAMQHAPHHRVYAVGADQRIADMRVAVLERERDLPVLFLKADALGIEVDRFRLDALNRLRAGRQQVGSVHGEIGITVTLDRGVAEVEELPSLAGVPQPHFLALGAAGKLAQSLEGADRVQRAIAVGTYLDAGADFAQFRRLLENFDIEAALQQRRRRRHAADAAAGNENPGLGAGHERAFMQIAETVSARCRAQPRAFPLR